MNQKTKNVAIDEKIHIAHKLNCLLAGKRVREATEDALREYWSNGRNGAKRKSGSKRAIPVSGKK